MAITRLTNAQILQTFAPGTALTQGLDATRTGRLDNGRMVAAWDSKIGGGAEVFNIATLDSPGLTHTAIRAADTQPGAKLTE